MTQRQIPGGPFINETGSAQRQIPGGPFVNETASTGVTGTSATTNANDAGSASGTTTVTGASAATNAADTSAASGTTTVLGASATTNAADTSNASGAVGSNITGSSATTNANDAGAAAGTTTVVGTLVRTNGSDTSSTAGTTTIVGTLARTNANDTATASGAAGAVTGTSATTNANDIASAAGVAASTAAAPDYSLPRAPARRKKPAVIHKDDQAEREAEFQALLARVKGQGVTKGRAAAKRVATGPAGTAAAPSDAPAIPRMPEVTGVPAETLRTWMPQLLDAFRIEYRTGYADQLQTLARIAAHNQALLDDEEEVAILAALL